MKPLMDENAAKDDAVPKFLTQMDHHEGCVNCVRWSNDGKYLASAGDDKLVNAHHLFARYKYIHNFLYLRR